MEQKTINIFACGGAAQNIAVDIIHFNVDTKDTGLADLNITLVDTSDSNYNRNKKVFHEVGVCLVAIPGLDGSGQIRRTHVETMMRHIPKIVNENGEDDAALNIVLSSASGGSGSVISSLITRELIEQGKNVVVMLVGDDSTRMFADNTANTIKSFEAISKKAGVPIAAHYFKNNSQKDKQNQINEDIASLVLDYRLLFGGSVHGVDSADLSNFLNYNKVTKVKPSLTLMKVVGLDDTADTNELSRVLAQDNDDDWYPISMVNIQTNKSKTTQDLFCEFRVDGEIDLPQSAQSQSLYFVLTDNYFYNELTRLEEITNQYAKNVSSRVGKEIDVSETDDSGLVL